MVASRWVSLFPRDTHRARHDFAERGLLIWNTIMSLNLVDLLWFIWIV